MNTGAMEGGHRDRLEAAYRRAAETHRRAEVLELRAVDFFEAYGYAATAARHRANAAVQHQQAEADDARAAAATASESA